MCGLTGFYETGPSGGHGRGEMHRIAAAMNAALAHRGPDSHDIWQDPDLPLVLAHRRLAIIDLSPEGHQPMSSPDGRYTIIYNGEIYNFLELQQELRRAGVRFRGRSDTEVLLAAIAYWGLNHSLQKIGGMFAFALWDRKERRLHFVRDRHGKKPLYIGWAGGTLVFGSELKALRAHPGFKPSISRHALSLYMRLGFIPAAHCIFEKTWSLPAGHSLTLDLPDLQPGADLRPAMQPFWDPVRTVEETRLRRDGRSEIEIVDAFEALLGRCTQARMISDVRLGAFLSGGIDSAAVVAMMQKHATTPTRTYTIGFHEDGYDEAAAARQVAEHLGTEHHELYLSAQDARAIVPHLPVMYDEPFADISAIPTALLARFARRHVTVALSGDGGDEMLGGYARHFIGARLWPKLRWVPRPLRAGAGKILGGISEERWQRLRPGHPQFGASMSKAARILGARSPFDLYNRLITHWDTPPLAGGAETDDLENLYEARTRDLNLSPAGRMMLWDTLVYLPYDILTKIDRATMAAGLEARAPLLDRKIFDFVWSLPEQYKIRGSKGKWLLREVLKRHVPEHLFDRPKQGFSVPVGAWLREDLRDWAESLLSPDNLESDGMIDPAPVLDAWRQHLNGGPGQTAKLWTVLSYLAWRREWR